MDEPSHLWSVLPLLIATVLITLMCYQIARKRDPGFKLWAVLSLLPVVNYFLLLYLFGSRALRVQGRSRRLRAIVDQLGR